ncbi:helix-turn-helix domain-containing protein [Paenibacillus sp. MER 99-2]|uniref:helix-turn-helix domain-containing protein n=1 Tax=Paenibacillus sp. MER 99-2 TaxID=2939572 RepID=UPI00203C2752|nr:helix-turn-helix domain-containing protein [Paenibacillus sp. MER 99-2]MCM3170888.1 helix-turn-helix domain-containing protein [Paenibacillus sp. MER 99-2]
MNPAEQGWIAEWHSTKPLTDKWIATGELHYFHHHAFILIVDGKATWSISGQKVHVSYGQLIALQQDSVIEVVDGGNMDLAGWLVEFNTYSIIHHEGRMATFDWKTPTSLSYQSVQLMAGDLARISQHMNAGSSAKHARWVGKQLLIHELLNVVYENQPSEEQTVEQGILRSIAHMTSHYDENITRNQLAQIAGLSPWHYSRKFSERYGKPPLDYLTHYRMYRAQEELILTTETSQNIAKKVGYEDAHYFSRRFKQFAGTSPRSYITTLSERKIVCLSPLCAEVLIGIGIIPYAVVVVPLLVPPDQHELFVSHGIRILPTSQYELNVELIQQEQPEMIIGNVWADELKQSLRTIAPLITGLKMDAEILLQQLAAIFHKQEEAAAIHMRMKDAVSSARQHLQETIQASAKVMVLRVEPFGYRYLGGYSHGVSRLLYQQLGLALPDSLQAGEAWFNPCSIEQLKMADPDILFVEKRVMEHFNAEESMNHLTSTPAWNGLKAVRNNRVFYVDTRLWADGYGLIGHTQILHQIVEKLTNIDHAGAQ